MVARITSVANSFKFLSVEPGKWNLAKLADSKWLACYKGRASLFMNWLRNLE